MTEQEILRNHAWLMSYTLNKFNEAASRINAGAMTLTVGAAGGCNPRGLAEMKSAAEEASNRLMNLIAEITNAEKALEAAK